MTTKPLGPGYKITKDGKVKKIAYARSVSEKIRQKNSKRVKPARGVVK